ncbi:MAG: hypothetical protein L3K15_06355 [Thermoplasmata archaeon]|nr:hypothetical protein [Thermoplasmata archaeon]
MTGVTILVNPPVTSEELYEFYRENAICEEGYPRDLAAVVLRESTVIVAAYRGRKLVAFGRAMFDGREAQVVEFCVARDVQGGELRFQNGSLIERDDLGIGHATARVLLEELWRRGAQFVATYIVEGSEEPFYAALGFQDNPGHRVFIIDRRPYVGGRETSGG